MVSFDMEPLWLQRTVLARELSYKLSYEITFHVEVLHIGNNLTSITII